MTVSAAPGNLFVNWNNSGDPPGATLTGYIVVAMPSLAGSPFSIAAGTTTLVVAAPPGSYSFTVQATYSAIYVGRVSSPAAAAFEGAQSIMQVTTVERPAVALVLTQRCGVYGSAPAYSDNVFGALPTLPPLPANADPGPSGYAFDGLPAGVPFNGQPSLDAAATTGDPLFPQYPYPVDANGDALAHYPTHCGIDLGIGRLVTSGPRAGQYFTANGRIAQVIVVNTQDVDNGWTLNGRMSAFTRTGGGDSFSGNLLGWDPEVTFDSAPNLDGYDMVVVAGGVRQPASTASTTGLGDASNESNTSLSQALAKANGFNAGTNAGSLGMAVLDARLRLLIPVTANAGTYTGTLTLTTI